VAKRVGDSSGLYGFARLIQQARQRVKVRVGGDDLFYTMEMAEALPASPTSLNAVISAWRRTVDPVGHPS